MTDFEKLIYINLQIENNKEDLNPVRGFKLYLFEALYSIQQFHGRYQFWDILFTIFEFVQLMAFPMDKIFDESWGNHWVKTLGNSFRYSQLIFLWKGTSFFIITYVFVCICIIILISLFFYVLIKSTSFASVHIIKFLVLMFQMQTVLNIPFLRTLFSTIFCENDFLEVSPEIKCQSGIHIFLIVLSVILIIIYKLIIILFHSTLYEFGVQPNKLKSGYTSSNEVILDFFKLILIIIYQLISHKMILAIATLLFSIILLIHFLVMQPYSSEFTMKLYLSLYSLFCWSCVICIGSILLQNSNFRSGIVLLIIGYPLLLIIINLQEWEFSIDKYFSLYLSNSRGGYNSLLEIEYFLKLEDSLAEKLKTREFKILFSYITDYEDKCTDQNCHLKNFMKIPFKPENFESLRILLLQHAELLYKQSILKHSNNIKLRIGYILFLFKKLNKKLKGKNEIILLDKFETNFECSFLIYKLKKYIEDTFSDKEEIKTENNNENLSQVVSSKEASKKIKSVIENIITKYVSLWNIMLIHDWNKSDHLIKMNHLGEDIKFLNKELNQNIKSLEGWNLLDQETMKIYIKYLKEIINHNEKAHSFINKISENEQNKHQYDEINLYELNYKEMSKNEEYKYIIINFPQNKIINVSFPVCKIFGYAKEELTGRALDILFPEIYNPCRKLLFQNKIEIYKKKLLIHNKKINSETWMDNTFGIDKSKFLISVKIKWFITSLDDEKIYGIGNIFQENKKLINDKDQETVYILTDRNLIIQNFTSNAQKMLHLNQNYTINDSNISNFITELNDNMINEFKSKNEKEESNISQVKNRDSRRTTRFIKSDFFLKKYNYLGQNTSKIIHWKTDEIIKENNDLKNSKNENINEVSSLSVKSAKNGNSSENLTFLDKNKVIDNKKNTAPLINKGINFTGIYNLDSNRFKNFKGIKAKDSNKNLLKQKELIFNMLIKEAKFNERKVGYIFILRPYMNKEGGKNININEGIKDLMSSQDNMKIMNSSDISLMSFADDRKMNNNPQSPFNLNIQNNDKFIQNFCKEKENQFSFDINDMTYKQFKYNPKEKSSFYEELKEKAIKKISDVKKNLQNDEGEEEEEEESSEYTSDENNSNSSMNSSKLVKENQPSSNKENKKVTEEIKENTINKEKTISTKKITSNKNLITDNLGQNNSNNIQETNKKKQDDFYHVNFSKISYYVFNYTTGFAELQKNQNHKISHVTYLINAEKEKLKHSNSRFIINAKLMKGRKKGSTNKKDEENEINSYHITSMRLKEIYRALSSKKMEKSIFKMFLSSIIIFILMIATGVVNIIIYYYLKNTIYSIFILIEKSDNLYQNLLFENSLVKELLMINNPFYTNTLNSNKSLYYDQISKMLYKFFSDNTFIISNLTNNFNILSKEDEENITRKQVDIYMIDPSKTTQTYYQIKNYSVLLYSAYRELNSALYHISQLKMEEIHHYNVHVYFFLKNGKSNLLIYSERQMWTLNEKMSEKIKSGHTILIICCIVISLFYCLYVFIFFYFYKNISLKRKKYISVLVELDKNLIISCLDKCEKFLKKLQEKKENNELNKRKISSDSSSMYNSEIENDNYGFAIENKNKDEKIIQKKIDKKDDKLKSRKKYVYQFILFFVFLAWQLGTYIFYYQRMTLYGNISTYEYYVSMFASNFIFVFIYLREYAFGKKIMFYGQPVDVHINNTLRSYYVLYSQSSKMKDIYRVYFPSSYQVFLNYLYNGKICEFIDVYNNDYPKANMNCDIFFYGSSKHGFFAILTAFVEEARMLIDRIDKYYEIAEKKNFTYNESLVNDPSGFYEDLIKQYENNMDEYNKYNPVNILKTDSHKELLITYLYVNTQVYSNLISESLKQFEQLFAKYNSINLILNILFIIVVTLGFVFIWIPFLFNVNKTFSKFKTMIYIIPNELLMNIPNINSLLEIE